MSNIKVGDKFVACWGYDQTQYSIYRVEKIQGKSVLVEGLNGWSNLDARDLAPGSLVKVFTFPKWEDRNPDEWGLGIDKWDYDRIMRKRGEESAEVRTIVKMNRIDGESWTYLWTLDNGEVVNSKKLYEEGKHVVIVKGLKKCLVKHSSYNDKMSIKIDDVIRAYHDPEYDTNANRYAEQNEYTAYHGR